MKLRSSKATIPVLALLGLLAACGGGGDDEAGSATPFSLSASTLTLSGGCPGGYVADVFVYGGAAPYRLDNTFPDVIKVSNMPSPPDPATQPTFENVTITTEVAERGGRFSVWFKPGGCFSPGIVKVVDKNDKQVTLTLTHS